MVIGLFTAPSLVGMRQIGNIRFYKVKAPVEGARIRNDRGGQGHFHAPRGSRLHQGADISTTVGQDVFSPIHGTVTKIGWANGTHRYVEITGTLDIVDVMGNREIGQKCEIRIFYVVPSIEEGDAVEMGGKIGIADDLHRNGQYPSTVGQHIHVELRLNDGRRTDPLQILPVTVP